MNGYTEMQNIIVFLMNKLGEDEVEIPNEIFLKTTSPLIAMRDTVTLKTTIKVVKNNE